MNYYKVCWGPLGENHCTSGLLKWNNAKTKLYTYFFKVSTHVVSILITINYA